MPQDPQQSGAIASSLSVELVHSLQVAVGQVFEGTSAGALARGTVFQLAGYYDDAVEAYSDALAADPKSDEAAARLTVAQLQSRKYSDALATATSLAGRNPRFQLKEQTSEQVATANTLLGDALANNGRLPDAINAYQAAARCGTQDDFVAGRLAQAYLASGNIQGALAQLPAIGANPRFRTLTNLLTAGQRNQALLKGFGQADLISWLANSVHGRPFFVAATARVAPIVWNDDSWSTEQPGQ